MASAQCTSQHVFQFVVQVAIMHAIGHDRKAIGKMFIKFLIDQNCHPAFKLSYSGVSKLRNKMLQQMRVHSFHNFCYGKFISAPRILAPRPVSIFIAEAAAPAVAAATAAVAATTATAVAEKA